jgi:hypothetical protein
MNPQQRLISDDTITKNYFSSNSDANGPLSSTEFMNLLRTNAMTKDGLIAVAKYYGVNDEWNNDTSGQPFSIKHYYELLLMVKKSSTTDHIWMSFYEGLHRHATMMMCLLCSKIDLVSNKVNHDSLTADYFKTKVSIKEFKEPDTSPLKQLERIFIDEYVKAPLLTTLVTIRAFIPRIMVSKIKHGDLEVLLKASRTYSENISITKRTSANKSMTIRLPDILETIEKMSKPAAWNDYQVRPLLTDTFKKQVDVTLALHLSNMKNANYDDCVLQIQ